MKPPRPHFLAAALLATVSVPLLAQKGHTRVTAARAEPPSVVDGSPLDWAGPLVPFNDQPVSIAAANDGESLYLVMTASESATRTQILRRGLIVWFDPAGGDKKKVGIKFPVGAGVSEEEMHGRRGGGYRYGEPSEEGGEARHQPPSLEPANRLEVFGPGKDDARSLTADKAPGIEVKVAQAEGLLTYELKFPLASNAAHPYAIGAKPGATIGVGLEMPKLQMPERGGSGGRGGGGMGGMGGGGGGRGGGGMGGFGGMGGPGGRGGEGQREFDQAKPLSGWVAVQLAAASTQQ